MTHKLHVTEHAIQGHSIVTVLGVREIRRAAQWMGRFDA